MTKEMDIYMLQDGFYVGHQKKNGEMAKGAKRVSENDIMTMFAAMMNAYCLKNNTDTLAIKDAEGCLIVARKLPTELGE